MSAVFPTLGGLPDGGGKPRAGQSHLAPVISGMLLVAIGTLYFWFSAGRTLSTDIELIRRISVRARTAVATGLRAAGHGQLAAPLQSMPVDFITPLTGAMPPGQCQSQSPNLSMGQCESSAPCASNRKVAS